MKTYKIKFEFYGRYMVTEIQANSFEEARRKIIDRINFIESEDITKTDPREKFYQDKINKMNKKSDKYNSNPWGDLFGEIFKK